MAIQKFQEILAWGKAHELTIWVYKVSESFPKNEVFGLTSQLRRAAVSIPSTIAEGFKRKGKKDSLHFYNISEGSLEEVKYQLLLARDLQYLSNEEHQKLSELCDEVGRILHGWVQSQR